MPVTRLRLVTNALVESVRVPAGDFELSGLLSRPVSLPRGTIVALHGGGMSASYFHGTTVAELSLLALGAAAGWNVLALDRPGYGASVALPERSGQLASQAEITFAALDRFGLEYEAGAGYLVVGHSYGFKLGLHLGAHSRGGELLGIDGSGAGRRYRPERVNNVDVNGSRLSRNEARLHFWGPPELYPPGTFDAAREVISRVPDAESREALTWPARFAGVAAAVRVPVRITLADHETWWVSDQDELEAMAEAFSAAPFVETTRHRAAGHNISLGWAARSYHLAALAFAERCLLRRRYE